MDAQIADLKRQNALLQLDLDVANIKINALITQAQDLRRQKALTQLDLDIANIVISSLLKKTQQQSD